MVTGAGQLYIPGTYVFSCCRDGARHTKKGRGSVQTLVAATLQVEDDVILLNRHMPTSGDPPADPTASVYIDVMGVRNPSTKGRNVRYRLAAAKGWECSFTLLWDRTVVPREQMRAVLTDAGVLCGLGDGRSIGFGRFAVLVWEELTDAEETSTEGNLGRDAEDGLAPRRRKVRAVPEAVEADGVPH